MSNLYQSVHEISVGRVSAGSLINEKQIGSAVFVDSDEKKHFRLKIWSLQAAEYYLVKNRNNERYTLFAKVKNDQGELPVYQEPIGFGYFDESLSGFIQLQINFPRQKIFMSFFSKQ